MLSDQTNITGGNNMSHLNNTTKNRKGKHLNYEDRLKVNLPFNLLDIVFILCYNEVNKK